MRRTYLLLFAVATASFSIALRAAADPLLDKKQSARARPRSAGFLSSFACGSAPELSCGSTVDSTTVGLTNHADAYACAEFDESGGEVTYRFSLAAQTEIRLHLDDLQDDLDLFVLSGCSGDSCVAASTGVGSEEIRVCLPPGTYWAVVDGFSGASSSFRLAFDCTPCSPCGPAMSNDTCSSPVEVPTYFESFHASGNTRCAHDDYIDATCTGFSSAGRDVVYRIIMAAGCTIGVTLHDGPDGVPLDRSIYLVTSCNDVRGTCIVGSDRGIADDESFTYTSIYAGIYYLIVDSFGYDTSGDYELDIQFAKCSLVAVQAGSWQQVKSLYR